MNIRLNIGFAEGKPSRYNEYTVRCDGVFCDNRQQHRMWDGGYLCDPEFKTYEAHPDEYRAKKYFERQGWAEVGRQTMCPQCYKWYKNTKTDIQDYIDEYDLDRCPNCACYMWWEWIPNSDYIRFGGCDDCDRYYKSKVDFKNGTIGEKVEVKY